MTATAASHFVGVDWATRAHRVCAENAEGEIVWEREYLHSGDGLSALCDALGEFDAGEPARVWVAIEVPHGAVVETLLERGFTVFSINPKQLDRFRDRFSVAGAKDDRLDARVLAASLRTDTALFRRLRTDAPEVIELREWSRMTDEIKDERTRLANRFREQLRRYYPQALALSVAVTEPWFLDLWERVPTPRDAQRIRETSIQKILQLHRIRRIDAASILATLRERPVTVAPGTVEAAVAHLRLLLARLRLVNRQIIECEDRLDALLKNVSDAEENEPGRKNEQRDAAILRSLPGVGRVVLATLLSEASQPLEQRDYHSLRALCGVAPVTRQSGKRCVVVMRKACHPRLRDALYHWSRVAAQCDPRSRDRYAELRGRGHSHGRALRTVGDRLLALAFTLLDRRELFDPSRYRDAHAHVA